MEIKEALVKAKQIADDKEFGRSRMAHVNGHAHVTWLDYFHAALYDLGYEIKEKDNGKSSHKT